MMNIMFMYITIIMYSVKNYNNKLFLFVWKRVQTNYNYSKTKQTNINNDIAYAHMHARMYTHRNERASVACIHIRTQAETISPLVYNYILLCSPLWGWLWLRLSLGDGKIIILLRNLAKDAQTCPVSGILVLCLKKGVCVCVCGCWM